jgi:hypothetical protein
VLMDYPVQTAENEGTTVRLDKGVRKTPGRWNHV